MLKGLRDRCAQWREMLPRTLRVARYPHVARCRQMYIGMVKVYTNCVLKAVNVDWVVTLSQNTPPCSWTFSTSWVFHTATSGIRDTVHHTYISTFAGNIFTPLVIEGLRSKG